jgi:hypothetical protein
VPAEARFAVGSRDGPRSTIWKVWVQGDEAYIASRMFGSDMKVSLHSTGRCQWSATDNWVRRQASVRNAERHVHRWQVDRPSGNESLLAFRVEIPVAELRLVPPPTDKKKVWWVSGAPDGSTVRFLFYLTRPSETDPAPRPEPEKRHLFSLQLRSSRWLVVFCEVIALSAADIAAARAQVLERVASAGLILGPDHRMSLFIQPPPQGGAHGLLERCFTEP